MAETIRFARMTSPLGPLVLAASDQGLCHISYGEDHEMDFVLALQARFPSARVVRDDKGLQPWARQIKAYWSGQNRRFPLSVDLRGLTEFQQSVLQATRKIPFGQTRSYQDVARSIGAPRAYRAVGSALGRNPLPIVIPCHRVVSASGIGGYTGGLHRKLRLMELEKMAVPRA